jgi:hypothetical protein
MGVGDEVQDAPWPGAVDAREQDIAVQGSPEAFLLDDAAVDHFDLEGRGCGAPLDAFSQYFDLGTRHSRVARIRVQEAVEIQFLDGVEVNQYDVLKTGAREGLGDNTSDTSGTDNPYTNPG